MQSRENSLPISVHSLVKSYGSNKVLNDISLDIRSGEFMTVLGPSSSGKTTLLMAIAGFVAPESGSIKVGGEEITVLPPHNRGIGIVFQSYALFPFMTVAQNVGYPLRIRGVSKGDIERRVGQALELVRLGPLAQRGIGQLSGGQRQRVALARAIVFQPRVILMDEPLSALDKQLREQMQLEIKHLHHEIGATTVYVTHDQREALTMSDRIAVFSQGRIEQVGTPEQIYRTPQSAFVAEFIGESTLIPVHVQPGRLSIENVHADLPLALQLMTGDCSLVARPEIFQILQEGVRPEKDFITFPATVREVIFQGDSVLVCSEVAGKQLVSARVSSTRGSHGFIPNQGSSIRLAVHFSDIVTVGRR